MRPLLQCTFPSPISDVVVHGERVFVALATQLCILQSGTVARRFDLAEQALVPADDGQTLLAVSPVLDPPAHYPLRSIAPPEEKQRMRRIHRLASPWTQVEDLGVIPVEGFCADFDGRYWPTFEGDDIHLFECTPAGIELRAQFATFWPYHLERTPQGVWVETSSLGATHYEILSLPELDRSSHGNLRYCKYQFPPETIWPSASGPTLAQPIFAVNAAGLPHTLENGQTKTHPINNVHRIMTLDDHVLATLSEPASGLAAAGERALFWAPHATGMEFLLICLRTQRVKSRFVITGATQAGARLFGADIALWTGETLRIYKDEHDGRDPGEPGPPS